MQIKKTKRWLATHLSEHAAPCCENPDLVTFGPFPPSIRCRACKASVGSVPKYAWDLINQRVIVEQTYVEATVRLRDIQRKYPKWRFFMVERSNGLIPDPSLIKVLPGHIAYKSPRDAENEQHCAHVWTISEGANARCVLCEGERVLDSDEVAVIARAEQAGVVFLRWPERLASMMKARKSGKRSKRRRKKDGSKATGGVAVGVEVPAGFVAVGVAAEQLGIEAKKLRKMIRSGRYEGTKVGGRVYVKME